MRWFNGGIAEAVALSKTRNAIFVVYIEGTDEQSKVMSDLLEQPEVSSRLERESDFVTIKLKSGSEAYTQFAQIYQLVPVPSIFFIWENGTPLEVVAGTVTGGATGLAARIDALVAKKTDSKSSPISLHQPSTSSSSNSMASSSSAFLAGEQGASAMSAHNPIPIVKVDKASTPEEEEPDEFETVCEGGVCFRRPKVTEPTEKTEAAEKSEPAEKTEPASSSKDSSSGKESKEAPKEQTEEEKQQAIKKAAEELSVEEKVERAKELIEKKRKEKEEKEKEEERQRELDRRAQGQGAAELKRWQQEQELKNLKEERLREKQENDKARARILEQIALDRADRQARFAPVPVSSDTTPNSSPLQPAAFTPSTDTSNITRIQFKMADGSTHTTQLDSDATLGELRQHVRENIQTSGAFTLSTMYPRRVLPETEDTATLRSLGLSPSASLLVLRGTSAVNASSVKAGGAAVSGGSGSGSPIANAGGFFGMITQLFWSVLVRPAQDLFHWLSGLVSGGGGGRRPTTSGQSGSQMGSSGVIRRPQSDGDSGVKRRRVVPSSGSGSGSSSVRREGNTYRLRDQDSDDENNTWNGNSTQQM